MPAGSEQFVNVATNRDSLEPTTERLAAKDLLHRDVGGGAPDSDFSKSRSHPVYPVRLPARSLSFSIGDLSPGAATSSHRHAYESLVYVLAGSGYTEVEDERIVWRAGDAFYVPPWSWHRHVAGPGEPVRYLTGTNLPLLVGLGQSVLRQEEPRVRAAGVADGGR
jgi:quercetin dioxygenase-like cupin family protein